MAKFCIRIENAAVIHGNKCLKLRELKKRFKNSIGFYFFVFLWYLNILSHVM